MGIYVIGVCVRVLVYKCAHVSKQVCVCVCVCVCVYVHVCLDFGHCLPDQLRACLPDDLNGMVASGTMADIFHGNGGPLYQYGTAGRDKEMRASVN